MNRKYLIILSLSILITLAGCSGISSKQKEIYTNNGQIAEKADTHSYSNRIGNKGATGSSNQVNLEFSKFYGTDTLWRIESGGKDELELNYNFKISNGRFKAVLITPKEEVLDLFEGTDEGVKIVDVDEGEYRLKIVGQDAKGKIQIEIKENTNFDLKKNE